MHGHAAAAVRPVGVCNAFHHLTECKLSYSQPLVAGLAGPLPAVLPGLQEVGRWARQCVDHLLLASVVFCWFLSSVVDRELWLHNVSSGPQLACRAAQGDHGELDAAVERPLIAHSIWVFDTLQWMYSSKRQMPKPISLSTACAAAAAVGLRCIVPVQGLAARC